jgi:CheY-like chemotaxis protein/predicted regulator of Ras-like GTPase activity (Roadblock/LC7/MglB family)
MASMSPPRVLLVDDHREVSNMLRTSIQLSGLDCVVIDVASGEDALLEMGRGPVDLLVADNVLPGISGLEVIERLQNMYPSARAILITGEMSSEVRRRAEQLGVLALLEKPIGTSLFLEAVARVLREIDKPAVSRDLAGENRAKLLARLQVLHASLGASSVQLIDSFGRIVDQEGQQLSGDKELVLSALAAASDAGQKVSELIAGLLPANVQIFEGGTHHLYLFNVGAFYNLVIAVESSQAMSQIGTILIEGRRAADELLDLLSGFGAVEVAGPERSVLEQRRQAASSKWRVIMDEEQEEVNSELEKAGEGLKRDQADKFWDEAINGTGKDKDAEDGILTYEEARDKGLLSEDDD